MNTRALLLTATLAAAPAAAQDAPSSPAPAPAPAVGADKATNLTLVVGAQSVGNVDRLGLARFEKFRDVPDGAVFEYGRFDWTPGGRPWTLSITAVDALQDDQRYHLDWSDPGRFSLRLGYVEVPRYYAADARTLWSGAGTTVLTVPNDVRQPIETAAGAPTSFAPAATLRAVMTQALAGSAPLDLRSERQAATGDFTYDLNDSLSFAVSGRYERRQGTRPLAVGTYTRRQALAGVPGTGAGSFWRETIEARGQELIEPVDQTIPELTLSGTWSKKGHSVSIGWHGSWFRNDATALYFDNPFEASTGRASAILFDPRSDQEPAAPSGNNALRGLYARSAIQLWPENTFQQVFASGSLRLGSSSRLSVNASRGSMRQDDAFLPYSENDQVIFSGVAGQPGAVLARNAPLPRASLDGEIDLTRADVRLTARPAKALALRAAYRYYDYDDASPVIDFPGYTSSSDSFFRRSIGQRDAQGNRVLFSRVGGFSRQRLMGGLAYTLGDITLDGEYLRTMYGYDHRQVEETAENAFKGTVRYLADSGLRLSTSYLIARRDFDGHYDMELETSGVRAFDVWTRDRDQADAELEVPIGDTGVVSVGGRWSRDEYPGAVEGISQPYGLQDSRTRSVFAAAGLERGKWTLGGSLGYDHFEWNSLQVTKTSQTVDYNPINRWTRGSVDDVFWIGLDAGRSMGRATVRGNVQYQRFAGDWTTANLATPDVNSAVAYAFPELKDSTLSAQLAFAWALSARVDLEARYTYEPYRLDDFTWDVVQPYPQGTIKETRSSPSDIGDMNVSRMLWLNSRYSDYDAHVLAAFVRMKF